MSQYNIAATRYTCTALLVGYVVADLDRHAEMVHNLSIDAYDEYIEVIKYREHDKRMKERCLAMEPENNGSYDSDSEDEDSDWEDEDSEIPECGYVVDRDGYVADTFKAEMADLKRHLAMEHDFDIDRQYDSDWRMKASLRCKGGGCPR